MKINRARVHFLCNVLTGVVAALPSIRIIRLVYKSYNNKELYITNLFSIFRAERLTSQVNWFVLLDLPAS